MTSPDEHARASRIAIRAKRYLDVVAGKYVAGQVIVISDGRIEAISDVPPDSCPVVDLADRTVLPGLIDAHTHIFLHSNRMANVTEQDNITYMLLQEFPSHRTARSVRALRIALSHGFTTIRDLGTEGAGSTT